MVTKYVISRIFLLLKLTGDLIKAIIGQILWPLEIKQPLLHSAVSAL